MDEIKKQKLTSIYLKDKEKYENSLCYRAANRDDISILNPFKLVSFPFYRRITQEEAENGNILKYIYYMLFAPFGRITARTFRLGVLAMIIVFIIAFICCISLQEKGEENPIILLVGCLALLIFCYGIPNLVNKRLFDIGEYPCIKIPLPSYYHKRFIIMFVAIFKIHKLFITPSIEEDLFWGEKPVERFNIL